VSSLAWFAIGAVFVVVALFVVLVYLDETLFRW